MKKQMFVSKLLLLTFALALGVIDTKAQSTQYVRLGTNAGKGVFMFGFEIGAGLPFGNIKGDYISVEDGQYSRESYNEPAPLGVLPILNLTLGLAF